MEAAQIARATLGSTEEHLLMSREAGKEYLVQVALPFGYYRNPNAQFDVVYAPDANVSFGAYASITQALPLMGEGPPLVVVAVGYPVEDIIDAVEDRQFDLMPGKEKVADEFKALTQEATVGGGADAFRAFLANELHPFIERRYRVRPEGRTFFGHSTGGTFALTTLFETPQLYHRYIVASPVVTFCDDACLRLEERYASQHDDLRAELFVGAGQLEDGQELLASMQISTNTRLFAEKLRSRGYPSLRLHEYEFPNETHCASLPLGLYHGLRSLFGTGSLADRDVAFPVTARA